MAGLLSHFSSTTLASQDSSSTTGSAVRGSLTSAVVVEQQKISRNVPPYIWFGCSSHPIPKGISRYLFLSLSPYVPTNQKSYWTNYPRIKLFLFHVISKY